MRLITIAACTVLSVLLCVVAYSRARREHFRCYTGTFDRSINSARSTRQASDTRSRTRTNRLAEFLLGCDGATAATADRTTAKNACKQEQACKTLCDSPGHKYPDLCRNHGRLQCIANAVPQKRDIAPLCKRKTLARAHRRRLCPASPARVFAGPQEKGTCSACKLPVFDRFPTPPAPPRDPVCTAFSTEGASRGAFACTPPSTQLLYDLTASGAIGNDTADNLVDILSSDDAA